MELNQVTLPTTDVARAIAFYTRLGLTLIVHTSDDYARFELPFGNATLSVQRVERTQAPGAVLVYFECEDLDARVEALRAAGIAFESGPEDKPWLWREAHLRDPDDNAICLFRSGSARRNPPWRLKPGQG